MAVDLEKLRKSIMDHGDEPNVDYALIPVQTMLKYRKFVKRSCRKFLRRCRRLGRTPDADSRALKRSMMKPFVLPKET